MHYIIYRITNLINGCFYIGKHKCDHIDDKYFGSGFILKQAIKKYGKENFIFHLEIDLHSQYEMDLLEKYVVNSEFIKRNDVYNVSIGGPNCILYGDKNGFFGKHHSDQTKKNISKVHTGMKHTEESKKQISETLKRNYQEHPELKESCKSNKGKVVVSKNGIDYYMNESEIPYHEGYIRGSHKKKQKEPKKLMSKHDRIKRIRDTMKKNVNRKWYNNGIEEKWCFPDQVPEGFVLGRKRGINVGRKFTDGTKLKMKLKKIGYIPSTKGKIIITNGFENKIVDNENCIPDGWSRGITSQNRNKQEIVAMDKNMNIVKEYDSVSQASKETGLNIYNLYHYLSQNSPLKMFGGFFWAYKLDVVFFF